ncbi:MAG: T9SS type A sorting domain-containing protein [Bacteroidales bacterium]|jgi:hypothetical protein|nr:T9SS type A sorting domain-containing protein [Bacteroidales bacterium]
MKQTLLFLTIFLSLNSISLSQNRILTRGAEPGELYLSGIWYGIGDDPVYETLRDAVYHITENGKKISIQYDVDYFIDNYTEPGSVMQPEYFMADATTGVLYNKRVYSKNSYSYTQLWVSFDYGKNWTFREELSFAMYYSGIFTHDNQSIMYRGGGGMYYSLDFGEEWMKIDNTGYTLDGDIGYSECEFLGLDLNTLLYTQTCYNTYTETLIDGEYMYGNVNGTFPDVYRGGKEGEVYVSSWFPDQTFKIAFSADTGYTFRTVYVSDVYTPGVDIYKPVFMSDRESGVFYILRRNKIYDYDPYGWHLEVCVDYYRDYGETLVASYCHDLPKDYGDICEPVNNLASYKPTHNSVLLSWEEPECSLPVAGYIIYRNGEELNEEFIVDTFYLDENLDVGDYNYYVVTHYTNGCISEISNQVTEIIELGIKYIEDNIIVFPNPTTGELTIKNEELRIKNICVFDVFGRHVYFQQQNIEKTIIVDISDFKTGIYFIQIQTENGIVNKKILKK